VVVVQYWLDVVIPRGNKNEGGESVCPVRVLRWLQQEIERFVAICAEGSGVVVLENHSALSGVMAEFDEFELRHRDGASSDEIAFPSSQLSDESRDGRWFFP
jgi:hypothetical protein